MTEYPRRPRGTGSIEILSHGFRPRMPGNGVRLQIQPTWEDAASLLDAAITELLAGGMVAPGRETLADYGIEVLDERELGGIRGVATERSRWRTHVASSALGRMLLTSIRRADVVAWRDELVTKRAAKGKGHTSAPQRALSRSSAKSALNLVRTVLGRALEAGLLRENPAHDVKLARAAARTHEPWTYLLPEEQTSLLSCADIPLERRLLIGFAMGTGMREGELWNLELVDVREDHVIVRYGSRGKATKSGKIRKVPIFGLARDALDRWLPVLRAQPNDARLLWPLPGGTRRQRGAPAWWRSALEAAGLVAGKRHDRRDVRFHDLRHTCGSSLVAGWWGRSWRLEEVRGLLGHSSITVTERYAHLAPSVVDDAARATRGEIVGRSSPQIWSHLRDLNSRPTVYEGVPKVQQSRALPSRRGEIDRGIVERSARALEAIADGDPRALRLAAEALSEVLRAAAESEPQRETISTLAR